MSSNTGIDDVPIYLVPEEVQEAVVALDYPEVEARKNTEGWKRIDAIDRAMAELPQGHFPLRHTFTPSLYTRQITMFKGSALTSRIHLYEHPFVISKGVVSVWGPDTGWVTYRAPHQGVTKPGTRRVLYIHEDTIWTTFHVNTDNETDPEKIVERVTYPHALLGHLNDLAPAQLADMRRAQRGEAPSEFVAIDTDKKEEQP